MTEMRRSRNGTFRGTLAFFDPEQATRRSSAFEHYRAELVSGATDRAAELGFKIDSITLRQRGFDLTKLPAIFDARGIRGVFILPACAPITLGAMDWNTLGVLRADCAADTPNLNSIYPDHAGALAIALDKLRDLGYRRPGLVLDSSLSEHQIHRWESAFQAYFLRHHGTRLLTLPSAPLVLSSLDSSALNAWLVAGQHDVVLAYELDVLDTLRNIRPDSAGAPGFCCFNLPPGDTTCAGLSLRARAIGQHAVELLIDKLLRTEPATPSLPVTSLIPATWVANDHLCARRSALCA